MRTTGKLRVVQVGCGKRAQAHIAAMRASGAIDLVALGHDRLIAVNTQ